MKVLAIIKKLLVLALVLGVIGSYTACRWDYHVSSYLFDKYCQEEGRVGLTVYESVQLDQEYFLHLSNIESPDTIHRRFIVRDDLVLNLEKLEEEYVLENYLGTTQLSEIGPIHAIETTVHRRTDGKLMAKASSVMNGQGFMKRLGVVDKYPNVTCPSGYGTDGESLSNKAHDELFRETFIPFF